MQTNIVGVKYEDEHYPKTFSGREYSYYTTISLNIGDIVEAPTKYGTSIAMVSSVDIPEEKILHFKNDIKTITIRLNKKTFLDENILEPAV